MQNEKLKFSEKICRQTDDNDDDEKAFCPFRQGKAICMWYVLKIVHVDCTL